MSALNTLFRSVTPVSHGAVATTMRGISALCEQASKAAFFTAGRATAEKSTHGANVQAQTVLTQLQRDINTIVNPQQAQDIKAETSRPSMRS